MVKPILIKTMRCNSKDNKFRYILQNYFEGSVESKGDDSIFAIISF